MNIEKLPKDELVSHVAELISDQDHELATLRAERRWLAIGLALTLGLFFVV